MLHLASPFPLLPPSNESIYKEEIFSGLPGHFTVSEVHLDSNEIGDLTIAIWGITGFTCVVIFFFCEHIQKNNYTWEVTVEPPNLNYQEFMLVLDEHIFMPNP